MSDFRQRVLGIVTGIPAGETMTYQEVAAAAGSPRAARAVGNIMKQNYDADIPCHRVIKSNGEIGEYNRGAKQKHALLKIEGAV